MKRCFIMRGVSGSGKTTEALRRLAGNKGMIHSTDFYFTDSKGVYFFEASKLAENHRKNYGAFVVSLKRQFPIVICDNCNHKRDHYRMYVEAAIYFGYEVEIVFLPHPDLEVAAVRNVHRVSKSTIERMMFSFEPHE